MLIIVTVKFIGVPFLLQFPDSEQFIYFLAASSEKCIKTMKRVSLVIMYVGFQSIF